MSWIIARHLPGEYPHIYNKIGKYNRFSSKRHHILRKIYTELPNSNKYTDFVARDSDKLFQVLTEYVSQKMLYREHLCYVTADGGRAILGGQVYRPASRAPYWQATDDLWKIWSEIYTKAIFTKIFRNCSTKRDILNKFQEVIYVSPTVQPIAEPRTMFNDIIMAIIDSSWKYTSAQNLIKLYGTSTSCLVYKGVANSLRQWATML
tara:strand:- start:333 stop:950 length:618 start_codon:yes stop_codon:yes gene_type:complete